MCIVCYQVLGYNDWSYKSGDCEDLGIKIDCWSEKASTEY